jgi:transcriptional regulator with XRE-family HTH domain
MSLKSAVTVDEVVGRRIKARRLQVGLSQQAIGDALGISYQQVQKYEKGVSRIGAGRLQQLAEILRVPVSFFLTKSLADLKPELAYLRSSTPPIHFVLFKRLPMCRIGLFNTAFSNWWSKSSLV